ncbi:MAG: hypothetical protein HWQ23_06110 [Nostoc sp. JL33]|uniref:hypothetical protein n=1 Tax=Nostoc sp. JL33 TaxID=2815396 RepID=UPI0025D960B3|nr:hypothetical protein [Nostoc sp. JL33]MBN3869878.1 hypothetical protein [Nostoc sp. JL33]
MTLRVTLVPCYRYASTSCSWGATAGTGVSPSEASSVETPNSKRRSLALALATRLREKTPLAYQ